ncbi:MAG: hypothetical protein ACJ8DI_25675 [Ktedonobacteraceae bacterium]
MILAILLDSAPPTFAIKPAGVLGAIIMGGLFVFAVYVCFVVGKNFQAFLKGIAWIVGLAIVGIVLILIFQAGHPGQ